MKSKALLYTLIVIITLGIAFLVWYLFRSGGKLSAAGRFASALVTIAKREYAFWGNGTIKEGDPKTMDRLRDYWHAAGVTNWSNQQMEDEAWSAAFISYNMQEAGAGSEFKRSSSHSTYITDAIKNRKENNDRPFKGYRPEEVKLAVGDLVCYSRQDGVDYDTTGGYKSHCDIVTDLQRDISESIGGNVSNSVSMTGVPMANGYIDMNRITRPYFVVIKTEM